jgi:hypothetical protein
MNPTARIAVGSRLDTARTATRLDVQPLWSEAGLAVTPTYSASARRSRPEGWSITHLASGYAVTQRIRRQRDAVTIARRLLDAGDWTRSRTAVTSDRHLRDRAAQILTEARLLGLR